MELSVKKNIRASVYVNNQRLIDLENSSVYSKVENDEIFIFIKHAKTGQSVKLVIQQCAEELDNGSTGSTGVAGSTGFIGM